MLTAARQGTAAVLALAKQAEQSLAGILAM